MAVKMLRWTLKALLAIALMTGAVVLVHAAVYGQSVCTSSHSTNTPTEASVVQQVNALRVEHGLTALVPTPALTRAADSHSLLMAQSGVFGHDSLAVTQARLVSCGNPAPGFGENIAGGNTDPTATYLQWFNSPPHLAAMIDPSFVAIGVAEEIGQYRDPSGMVWSNFPLWTLELSTTLDTIRPPPQPAPTPSPTPQPGPGSASCAVTRNGVVLTVFACP